MIPASRSTGSAPQVGSVEMSSDDWVSQSRVRAGADLLARFREAHLLIDLDFTLDLKAKVKGSLRVRSELEHYSDSAVQLSALLAPNRLQPTSGVQLPLGLLLGPKAASRAPENASQGPGRRENTAVVNTADALGIF
ncbi:hypothetical protein CB1_001038010 [Camelus ferus]|nr:hypothetical protein CB1_001038010 [Camelus ferus]